MKKLFITAEASGNNNGSSEIAKKLIVAARDCDSNVIDPRTFLGIPARKIK